MKRLFSVMGCLGLSVCIGVTIAVYYGIDFDFLFAMITCLPGFVLAKIVLGFFMQQGAGFFALEDQRSSELTKAFVSVFKMRPWLVIYLGIMVVLSLTIMYASFVMNVHSVDALGESTVRNFKAFSLAISSGIFLALIHWVARWKDYFYGSEYNARVEFKAKGYDKETIEQNIVQLRKNGVFGKTAVVLLVLVGTILMGSASYAEDSAKCTTDQEVVENMISDRQHLGNARFELLIKQLSYEKAIPLIENPECREVMKKYHKDLSRYKKEKNQMDKILK